MNPDEIQIDYEALEVARKEIEDFLIEMRNSRISILGRGNGFVIREFGGEFSDVIRLGTPEGLEMGIRRYIAEIANKNGGKHPGEIGTSPS